MENPEQKSGQEEKEKTMEDFYQRFWASQETEVKKISLENLRELKEKEVTTEDFLNFLGQRDNILLHGSISQIDGDKLEQRVNSVFATDNPAVAIMRSVFSNRNANLEYPYFIDDDHPFSLTIHTKPDGEFLSTKKGYVYIVGRSGFINKPISSWQFISEDKEVKILGMIETERADFNYPTQVVPDLLDNQ